MTRRTLTQRGLSALAGWPASGASKIRCAMIGTGHGHAASKLRALRSMPEYEFVGVCRADPDDPEAGDVFAAVPQLALREILEDARIEMVAIELADPARNLAYASQAVAAGKYVHLDKPPGADLNGLRRLLDEARKRGRIVQMGYQWRYHPAMEAVLEAARKGWLGRVYRFRASIDKPVGAEERRHLAKYPGGMMFSEGCHLIDRATSLLGRPEKVTGFIRHDGAPEDGLADNSLAILEYPKAIAEISMAGFDPYGGEHRLVEVLGTNGSMRAQPFAPARLRVKLKEPAGAYPAGEKWLDPPAPPGLGYTPDFAEMAAVIGRGAAPRYSAAHDLMTHEVLLTACGML